MSWQCQSNIHFIYTLTVCLVPGWFECNDSNFNLGTCMQHHADVNLIKHPLLTAAQNSKRAWRPWVEEWQGCAWWVGTCTPCYVQVPVTQLLVLLGAWYHLPNTTCYKHKQRLPRNMEQPCTCHCNSRLAMPSWRSHKSEACCMFELWPLGKEPHLINKTWKGTEM